MQLNTKALSPKGLANFSVLTFMPSASQTFGCYYGWNIKCIEKGIGIILHLKTDY